MNREVRNSGASHNASETNSTLSAFCDRIILYVHHSTRTTDVNIYPVTGTASIVIDLVVPDGGTLSFSKTDVNSRTDIVGDGVIFHDSIARSGIVISYSARISVDCAAPNRETFPMNKVDAMTTVSSDCDILDDYI